MCSKTSSVTYGNRSEEDDYYGLCPKKQKQHNNGGGRRRVPRRGPGVAELEKIRLEEQQHNSSNVQLPLPSPPEKSQTVTDKTGLIYPFPSYFSTGSFPNDLIPTAPVFHMKHDSPLHYLPPMSLPSPASGGFYHLLEPPSNQTSSRPHHFLNEEKVAGVKRPWRFMAETTKCSGGPTITISRDGKQIRSVDVRLKNYVQDSGASIKNPITIDSPSPATPTIIPDFPRFLQKEDFDRELMSRKSAVNSLSKKPFYSFLPSKNEQSNRNQDRSFSLKTERYDSVTDQGIDLRLKL